MDNQNNFSQEEWVKTQYQNALKYLADKGIVGTGIDTAMSRHLGPFVAIWKITDNTSNSYWVVNGDVPTDHVNIDVASDARDVLRHFSLKWQLQAENLVSSNDSAQKEFGALLIKSAENVYKVFEDDNLWQA